MTTIKEHIEQGHYPVDDKGRALVPVGCNLVATICATDAPGYHPIIGFIRGAGNDTCPLIGWHVDGAHNIPRGAWTDLLPPPPRKVKVMRDVQVNRDGNFSTIESHPADLPFKHSDGWQMVELTGEYEEPWT